MRLKVQPRFQFDARGMRARVGDVVLFHVDPEKPGKRPSEGTIVRWVKPRLAEIRYTGKAYDGTTGPHYFDVVSSEFVVGRAGPITARVERTVR